MALTRCEKHPPRGRRHAYRAYALPAGYPGTAATCGRKGCDEPACLWLDEQERRSHSRGIRIFSIRTNAARLRVGDEVIQAPPAAARPDIEG